MNDENTVSCQIRGRDHGQQPSSLAVWGDGEGPGATGQELGCSVFNQTQSLIFGLNAEFLLTFCWNKNSVRFSCSVVSDSLRPHEPQHTRPPCPSPTPGVYPNLCPLSWWCHPTISSSVVPFSSCPQSFPASGSFQMSQVFASGE